MKKAIKKTVAKKAAKVVTPKVTMTLKQAQTIQKALGKKSYKFLDKKIGEVANV